MIPMNPNPKPESSISHPHPATRRFYNFQLNRRRVHHREFDNSSEPALITPASAPNLHPRSASSITIPQWVFYFLIILSSILFLLLLGIIIYHLRRRHQIKLQKQKEEEKKPYYQYHQRRRSKAATKGSGSDGDNAPERLWYTSPCPQSSSPRTPPRPPRSFEPQRTNPRSPRRQSPNVSQTHPSHPPQSRGRSRSLQHSPPYFRTNENPPPVPVSVAHYPEVTEAIPPNTHRPDSSTLPFQFPSPIRVREDRELRREVPGEFLEATQTRGELEARGEVSGSGSSSGNLGARGSRGEVLVARGARRESFRDSRREIYGETPGNIRGDYHGEYRGETSEGMSRNLGALEAGGDRSFRPESRRDRGNYGEYGEASQASEVISRHRVESRSTMVHTSGRGNPGELHGMPSHPEAEVLRRFNFPPQPPPENETNPRNRRNPRESPREPYLGRLSLSRHQSTQSRFTNTNEMEDTRSRFDSPSVIKNASQQENFGNEWSLSLSWLNQAAFGESYLSSASASEASSRSIRNSALSEESRSIRNSALSGESRSIRNSALSEDSKESRLEFGGGSHAFPYDRVPDNRNSTGFAASLRTSGDWSFDKDVRSILSVPISGASEAPEAPPLLRHPGVQTTVDRNVLDQRDYDTTVRAGGFERIGIVT
ncbi:hypothetical protein FPQ18DRAFT_24022 [Pyronema domesticum]|nr:hypothetical protein FPQ18DRAFT_24022 [Pyronema domesticum]